MNDDKPATQRGQRIKTVTIIAMAVLILVPSMLGFVAKFIEFLHTFRGDSGGAFAITPILNYLLASLGFFCLLIWAISKGMFHDIEGPKHVMLQRDRQLDGNTKSYR